MPRKRAKVAAGALLAAVLLAADTGVAQNLIVDGSGTMGPATFNVGPTTARRYDHVCVINGGVVTVTPYAEGQDKSLYGNLELIASSIYVDEDSLVSARGAGYSALRCDAGGGPNATAGGRGGCSVRDSGGGGAHFGRGGRGTIDNPTQFPRDYEDDCDHDPNAGSTACSSTDACGNPGPSVAGLPYWHNVYDVEFGASGGDKGCRDGDGFATGPVDMRVPVPMVGGAGGGRVVLVGLADRLGNGASATSPCGLSAGTVRIDGVVDAAGKRGCGIENDSGGGGAGGSVLIVGDNVRIGETASVSAAGGLGGDTRAAASDQPDHTDCAAGAQSSGLCDDCGGGGGGGIISVLSVSRTLEPSAAFNVSGALGGTCNVCKGEAGGGAGELQLDGAYVGELCDGYDNDFDGVVDEGLGAESCGLGSCALSMAACENGMPVSCSPVVDPDEPSCSASPEGARPRIAVILDTSASMLLDLAGYPTFGDGSVERPGIDTDNDGQPNDSRLSLARESLAQVISAYPEIDFALARYHQKQGENRSCQTARWFECQSLVASYDDPRDNTGASSCNVAIGPDPDGNGPLLAPTIAVPPIPHDQTECINYAGSCGGPRRGADVLSGFGTPARDIVRWLDGRETGFDPSETPGNVCDHAGGGDCEVRGTGPTPLDGSLLALADYITPIRATDPATACRGYSAVLVTDGAESCDGDPAATAQQLHDSFGIEVYVIAVSVLSTEQASLEAIARAGSGNQRGATFVTAPEQLVPALTSIIAGSIRHEDCNGLDDDCDGKIDEDFPGLGSVCDNGALGICREPGVIACNAAEDGTECKLGATPQSPGVEICNTLDDDCDSKVDEGLDCTTPGCVDTSAEVCNARDDDCDGKVDENDPALDTACGSDLGVCSEGRTRCVAGVLRCVGGNGPLGETCNGVDDDCNDLIDDDAPCPVSTQCIEGACRRRCEPDREFSCPIGLECKRLDGLDGAFCVPTACAACSADERCIDDVCVDSCKDVECAEGRRCVRGNCRDCNLLGCDAGQVCFGAQCIDDPCASADCASDEMCVAGSCVHACSASECDEDQSCGADGTCSDDPCAGVECEAGQSCDDGTCRSNPCVSMQCVAGDVCVPALGCVNDPCPVVRCPEGRTCVAGRDGQARCDLPDATPGGPTAGAGAPKPRRFVTTGGGGGLLSCAARPASQSGSAAAPLWFALAWLATRARRGRR
jgi:hypothetical protein